MPHSTERLARLVRSCACAVVLGLVLVAPASTTAEDGTLRVRESALNAFAVAVQPLAVRQSWTFTLWIPVPNPFLLGIPTPLPIPFTCDATASVTGVAFDIDEGSASVRGDVSGTVCGLAYRSALSSGVSISIDPAGRRLSIRPVAPMSVGATVNFMGVNVTAPFSNVRVAPALSVMSIPLDTVALEVETPSGPRTLGLVSGNHQLALHDGFFEIKADAYLR